MAISPPRPPRSSDSAYEENLMDSLTQTTLTLLAALTGRLRRTWNGRDEAGASTLELVILILGLIAVATLLVATLTAAVRSRTDQIT
jgi:hypothetical protein